MYGAVARITNSQQSTHTQGNSRLIPTRRPANSVTTAPDGCPTSVQEQSILRVLHDPVQAFE